MKLAWPLFKFLRPEHAKAMLEQGIVRVGTLHEYRDAATYGQLTLDPREGQRTIQVVGPRDLSPDDLSLLGLRTGSSRMRVDGKIDIRQDWPNCNVYCTSGMFFNDSVRQARVDLKSACVAILDPGLFFTAFDRTPLGVPDWAQDCIYAGKDAVLQSAAPLLKEPRLLCHPAALKEPQFAAQREVRAIWSPNDAATAQLVTLPNLSRSFLPLSYDSLDIDAVLARRHTRIGVRVLTHSGREGVFSTLIPGEPFSAVVVELDGTEYIAFVPESRDGKFVGSKIKATDFALQAEQGVVLCAGTVREDVRALEYFSEHPG